MVIAVAAGVFLLTVLVTRYVSLGSLLGSWAAFAFSLTPPYGLAERISVLALVCLITYQHRANIQRLLKGNESKIRGKAKAGVSGLGKKGGAAR